MLRDYSRKNGLKFNSMIGGCESIRDIQEGLVLGTDSFECPAVESEFAIRKLTASLKRTAGCEDLARLELYINIGTTNGVSLVMSTALKESVFPFERRRIVFMFDRRMMAAEIINAEDSMFEVEQVEEKLNEEIEACFHILRSEGFSYGISGGITVESLDRISNMVERPSHIKCGLFTFVTNWERSAYCQSMLKQLQVRELEVLGRTDNILSSQSKYVRVRRMHLERYLGIR